jgi:hypothetical protein
MISLLGFCWNFRTKLTRRSIFSVLLVGFLGGGASSSLPYDGSGGLCLNNLYIHTYIQLCLWVTNSLTHSDRSRFGSAHFIAIAKEKAVLLRLDKYLVDIYYINIGH